MSAAQLPSLLSPVRRPSTWLPPIQVQPPIAPPAPTSDEGRIVFTRQLWQRTMPDEQTEHAVSIRSYSQGSLVQPINTSVSRRASSIVSSRSLRSASSPSGSKTPLTPKESPPFRSTRKRTASIAEREDKGAGSSEVTPAHTRASSGDSASQVCLCQPDPKIPRPRNAFILYRQHHQAKVVAQHPGLANPDISKIIGEQWRNQPNEVKNEWKALAEEEKIRHQQQYPTYRYQPKRNGRRNSITSDTPGSATSERPRCNKCGGRAILAPSTPYTTTSNATSPSHTRLSGTPGSGPTPISRTLPILRDLSLQSPAARRMRQYAMTPSQHHPDDTMETIGPLSPDAKRRRFNEHPPQQLHRTMPPRYPTAPPQNIHPGPGTPFPFGPTQQPSVYAQAPSHLRRDSLPGLRGMVSAPGPMPPPPRPGMGYQQHRMSQGGPDRSLTLPPLQTGTPIHHQPSHSAVATPRTSIAKPVDVDLPFRYKLDVLRQIAPPAPIEKGRSRGPLVSIEGEDVEAVKGLAAWLANQLAKDGDVDVKIMDGPLVTAAGSGSEAMANHHVLAADWLRRNEGLLKSLQYGTTAAEAPSTAKPTTLVRRIEEILDDDDDATPTKASPEAPVDGATEPASSSPNIEQSNPDAMSISPTSKSTLHSLPSSPPTLPSTTPISAPPTAAPSTRSAKPVTILPLFTLHATNNFTSLIPITDSYSLKAHWEWAAAQWRGVVGPDLTIYVRDGGEGKAVEMSEEGGVCVVRRGVAKSGSEDGKGDAWEGEEGTLRRVGFEVGEWVRAFGTK
ncbi:slightly ste11-like protein [Oleoguttula sp. CCFEE 5521]